MAIVSIQFGKEINSSLQVGDTVYFCPQQSNNIETNFNIQNGDILEIGTVIEIYNPNDEGEYIIKVRTVVNESIVGQETILGTSSQLPVANSDFIFFSKDNLVNTSSPIGYFASVKFVNDALVKSEMFATACEIFESSK